MCCRDFMKDEVGYMSLDLFKQIFKRQSPDSIKLNWRGEPLLNKNIVKMVRYAKEKGVTEVSLNTNGLLLNDSLLHSLAWAGLDWIIFSVDSVNPSVYEEIRIGGDYEKLVKNIIKTKLLYDSMSYAPKIRIQICKQPKNEHEIKAWKRAFGKYADKLRVGKLYDPQGKRGYKMSAPDSCTSLWQRLTIDWQGNICACPGDFLRKVNLGNLKDTGIREAWHSTPIQALRGALATSGRGGVVLCESCTSYC